MTNGQHVAELEAAWADRVGARYAVALCNGTATLHTALVAMGIQPGQQVWVPPLTMASTALAVLHAGGEPVYADVDKDSWLMLGTRGLWAMPVDLYGLHYPHGTIEGPRVDDAAQCLRQHDGRCAFTSYSLQASKIIAAGEGGVLVTDDEGLAQAAREFSSLGYQLRPDQPRIDPAVLKHPYYERHHTYGMNFRMADAVAQVALKNLKRADKLLEVRQQCAALYADAIDGCSWLKPQDAQGMAHDYWAYTVAVAHTSQWEPLVDAIVKHGGERPYAAWRLTYTEPALQAGAACPNAESVQPRLLQFQTNKLVSAQANAAALKRAIEEAGE